MSLKAQKLGPPLLSTVIKHCGIKPGPVQAKLDSLFILDVNVLDGTMMAPSTPFTKIWRLRNSGSVVWPKGTRLVWIGGDRFSHADSAELEVASSVACYIFSPNLFYFIIFEIYFI